MLTSSRYAFRRHFIQHAGFRYVVGEGENEIQKYENIAKMAEQWGKRYE
jgi:hypothetical protein